MNRLFIIFLLFILLSCQNEANVSDQKSLSPTPSASTAIKGFWAATGNENSNFEISDDSIFYTDLFESYPYQLKNDTLTIRYPGYEENFKVSMKGKDTLILENNDPQTYYRFKN